MELYLCRLPACRTDKFTPVSEGAGRGRWGGGGISVMPGKYFVSMAMYAKGEVTELAGPEPFVCKPLDIVTMPVTDPAGREKMDQGSIGFLKDGFRSNFICHRARWKD